MRALICILLVCKLLARCDLHAITDSVNKYLSADNFLSDIPSVEPFVPEKSHIDSWLPWINTEIDNDIDKMNAALIRWDVFNPIDLYFGDIYQQGLGCEAAFNDYMDLYGTAWEREYKNLFNWAKRHLLYAEDIENLVLFNAQLEDALHYAIALTRVADFTIHPDLNSSRCISSNVYIVGKNKVILYRFAFHILCERFPDYEYLEQDYIPQEIGFAP